MAAGQSDIAAIEAELANFADPETGRGIARTGQVSDVKLDDGALSLTLALTTHSSPLKEKTRAALVEQLRAKFPDLNQFDVTLAVHERPPEPLGEIGLTAKSVVAVGSGKGGVGKSTIAASIAFGLQRAGCTVGLMDADVYGPSVPHLVGAQQRPELVDRKLTPIEAGGVKVMSMGFLMKADEAVVWRGPMLHGAITQMLRDTAWGPLDYLIIDMPPGTGDIALTLSQILPLTGAVVVCTPQDVALLDAIKAIDMFGKVHIPILGVVENMSYFECTECHARHEIFGSGGAKRRAETEGVPFLGEVPINLQIRLRGDAGETAANFDDPAAAQYLEPICLRLAENISAANKEKPALPSLSVI
jgi:ATP-binding protein involved in chromosome partitioning